MNHYNQHQTAAAAAAGTQGNLPTSEGPYVAPPPPMGYPVRDQVGSQAQQQQQIPVETRSRGDGFWKGCCAALCCCCAIDICF